MAVNWGGAGQGALTGASVGSIFGPWGPGIGAAAGGLLGLFSGRKNKGGSATGGASNDFFMANLLGPLLSQGQEGDIVNRLMGFNDTPGQPLGRLSRGDLMERLDPNYIPQFFRNDVLNPFLNAQFRLGREQRDRDVTSAEAQFQRLGAFFSPDMPAFTQRINERQNLNEQDFLSNLGFQGGQIAEQIRTDAIARSLGLEQVTAGVLDRLLARQNQREGTQLGFQGGLAGSEGQVNTVDPLGFFTGALPGILSNIQRLQGSREDGSGEGDDFLGLSNLVWQNQKRSFFPGP